ncbi:MAG TPA: MFS transporter [Gammaproteobacteria bacterium]|jgi:MFS family permease|nr:MFS transporter [Gammaproteobacteria bacterium]
MKEKTQAWVVTITTSLFLFYIFIQMNLFNTMNVQLRSVFQLDAMQLGQLFSMFFYSHSLMLFFAGSLLDRFSMRKLLLIAVSIATAGTFIFAFSATYWVAAAGRFLTGAGAAFCFLSCIRVASRWFPPQKMAFVTGVVVTIAMIGGLVAQTPFALLVDYCGLREALFVNAFLGLVVLLAIFLIVQDRPASTEDNALLEQAHLKSLGLWRCLKLAAGNRQNWFGGFYTTLLNLPVFIIGGLWGILYLTEVHHLTTVQASYATTVFFIGVILGSLIFGWLSDAIAQRVLPMKIGAVLSLIVMLLLMYLPGLSLWSIMLLLFLIGFVTSSQVLTYPTIAELNPRYLTSTALSIGSICIMASGFIFPPLFGWLMEHLGKHTVVDGVTVYTADNLQHAMWMMPIAFIVGLIITRYMQETFCRSLKE